jgi:hypothetical protein
MIYDATVHPRPVAAEWPAVAVTSAPRLEVVGNATIRGHWWKPDAPSFWVDDVVGGRFDLATLDAYMAEVKRRGIGIVSLNVEDTRGKNPHRYRVENGAVVERSVSAFNTMQLAWAARAHAAGLLVCAPFEAFHEAEAMTLESDRLIKYLDTPVHPHARVALERHNNDAHMPTFDASDFILVRNYFETKVPGQRSIPSTLTPAQITTVIRHNLGEGRRLARKGQRIISIVKPETLTDAQLAALVAAHEGENVDVATWAEPDLTYANQAKSAQMATAMVRAESRQD